MNFMTAFPLIISSFCIPGPPALIQSTADSKRGIDSFSLNSASSPAPAIVLILNVRPVPDEGFIYIYISMLNRVTKRVARLPFHLSSNYYHRFAVDREWDDERKDTRDREREGRLEKQVAFVIAGIYISIDISRSRIIRNIVEGIIKNILLFLRFFFRVA